MLRAFIVLAVALCLCAHVHGGFHRYKTDKQLRNFFLSKRQTTPTNSTDGDQVFCFSNCTQEEIIPYAPGSPHQVAIGIFINSLAALDVENSVVELDAYIWLKWARCSVDQFGTILRPDLSLTIENSIQRVDLTMKTLFNEPDCLADPGYVYQIWRIEGQFYEKLNFQKYPLDIHPINIAFEDAVYARDYMIYIKDDLYRNGYPASGISGNARLSGWTIEGFWEQEMNSEYPTNWGAVNNFYSANSYSNYQFGVYLYRGAAVYLLKVLPPIIITLLISGFSIMMDIEATDVRIGTAVSGLLTLVFLQLTFSDKLPASLDYLTLMDWVFNLGYVMCVTVVVECIVIRKIYYRLLLQTQTLKDDIQLSELLGAFSSRRSLEEDQASKPHERDTPEAVAEKARNLKRRKEKIKRRIRHLEKILFVGYLIFGSAVLFCITMIENFIPQ